MNGGVAKGNYIMARSGRPPRCRPPGRLEGCSAGAEAGVLTSPAGRLPPTMTPSPPYLLLAEYHRFSAGAFAEWEVVTCAC